MTVRRIFYVPSLVTFKKYNFSVAIAAKVETAMQLMLPIGTLRSCLSYNGFAVYLNIGFRGPRTMASSYG
jgi:hypothetical protein